MVRVMDPAPPWMTGEMSVAESEERRRKLTDAGFGRHGQKRIEG